MKRSTRSWDSSLGIRLRVGDFARLRPEHLFSSIDDPPDPLGGGDDVVNGTTEWSAAWEGRQLSFGFDWQLHKSSRQIAGLWQTLRTNLVVVGARDDEQGEDIVRATVEGLLEGVRWDETVKAYLRLDLAH